MRFTHLQKLDTLAEDLIGHIRRSVDDDESGNYGKRRAKRSLDDFRSDELNEIQGTTIHVNGLHNEVEAYRKMLKRG
jgi:hypothetical protein